MELESLRREYLEGGLSRDTLAGDPIKQFELWLQEAIALGITDPTAMVLATAAPGGQPSQRIVLLKGVDARGFVFYTNYTSRKAREALANPQVSLLFPWHGINRQVNVRGRAEKVSAAESTKYFSARPRESQLAAWTSRQSEPLSSRRFLTDRLERMKEKFAGASVPPPDFWGGFRVTPSHVEFWQGAEHRLHDRFEYSRRDDGAWSIQRLAP